MASWKTRNACWPRLRTGQSNTLVSRCWPNSGFALGRLYEQTGQPEQALSTYRELMDTAPSMATCLMLAERFDALEPQLPEPRPDQSVRVALLGNATLDHLQSYLKVECYRSGLRPAFYQAGFDQYNQESGRGRVRHPRESPLSSASRLPIRPFSV